jgi:hypothetical protein
MNEDSGKNLENEMNVMKLVKIKIEQSSHIGLATSERFLCLYSETF